MTVRHIAQRHLPFRLPLWQAVTLWLLLDRIGIPAWAWGVYWTLTGLLMLVLAVAILNDSRVASEPRWKGES